MVVLQKLRNIAWKFHTEKLKFTNKLYLELNTSPSSVLYQIGLEIVSLCSKQDCIGPISYLKCRVSSEVMLRMLMSAGKWNGYSRLLWEHYIIRETCEVAFGNIIVMPETSRTNFSPKSFLFTTFFFAPYKTEMDKNQLEANKDNCGEKTGWKSIEQFHTAKFRKHIHKTVKFFFS